MHQAPQTLLGTLAALRQLQEAELTQVAGSGDIVSAWPDGTHDRYQQCAPTGSDWVGTDCD